MNEYTVLPMKQWVDLFVYLIDCYISKYPEDKPRINKDKKIIKIIIECMVHTELSVNVKYKYEPWDTEHYIDKIYKNYFPIPTGESSRYHGNPESTDFFYEVIDQLESRISTFLHDNVTYPHWELFQIYKNDGAHMLRVYGDYRASEWCKANDIQYELD